MRPRNGPPLAVISRRATSRAGAPDATVRADRLGALAEMDFGEPLHLLVIPGDLHHVEADALAGLAGAPADLLAEK